MFRTRRVADAVMTDYKPQQRLGALRPAKLTPLNALRGLVLAVVVLIQVYPLIWLAFFSLKDNQQIYGNSFFSLPAPVRWGNYVAVITNLRLELHLLNSAIVTSMTVVVTVMLSTMAAFAITRLRWKLRGPVLTLFLVGIMIPVHTSLLPLFVAYKATHMLNTYWALLLPYSAFQLGRAIFIMTGFFRVIPKEFEEAACIDGCSIYRTFFMIMLPLVKTATATIAVIVFLRSWNELMLALTFITTTRMKTLPVAVMSFQGQYTIQWGLIGAAMIVATIPALLVYFLFSEQMQRSLTAGALKG